MSVSSCNGGFPQAYQIHVCVDEEIDWNPPIPAIEVPKQTDEIIINQDAVKIQLLHQFLLKTLAQLLQNPQGLSYEQLPTSLKKYLDPCTTILKPPDSLQFLRQLACQLTSSEKVFQCNFQTAPYHLPTPLSLSWIPNHDVNIAITNPALRILLKGVLIESEQKKHFLWLASHLFDSILDDSEQTFSNKYRIIFSQMHLYYEIELDLKQIILLFFPELLAENDEKIAKHNFSDWVSSVFSPFNFGIFDIRLGHLPSTTLLFESLLLSPSIPKLPESILRTPEFLEKSIDYVGMLLHFGIIDSSCLFSDEVILALFNVSHVLLNSSEGKLSEKLFSFLHKAYLSISNKNAPLTKKMEGFTWLHNRKNGENLFAVLPHFNSPIEQSFLLADLLKIAKFKEVILRKKSLECQSPATPKRLLIPSEETSKKSKGEELSSKNALPIQGFPNFPNPGNVCFISAALQSLFCMQTFRELLNKPLVEKHDDQNFNLKTKLQEALIELEKLRRSQQNLGKAFLNVVNLLFQLVPDIKDKAGAFHDTTTILEALLEIFGYTLKCEKTYSGKEENVHLKKSTQEVSYIFQIPVRPRASLQTLVRECLAKQTVKDNPWRFTDTNGKETILKTYYSQQSLLEPLPNLLAIQAIRMKWDADLQSTVQVDTEITESNPLKINNSIYSLQACIYRNDLLMHYHADVLIDGQWFRCDDNHIVKIAKPNSRTAYIYLYEKEL